MSEMGTMFVKIITHVKEPRISDVKKPESPSPDGAER